MRKRAFLKQRAFKKYFSAGGIFPGARRAQNVFAQRRGVGNCFFLIPPRGRKRGFSFGGSAASVLECAFFFAGTAGGKPGKRAVEESFFCKPF